MNFSTARNSLQQYLTTVSLSCILLSLLSVSSLKCVIAGKSLAPSPLPLLSPKTSPEGPNDLSVNQSPSLSPAPAPLPAVSPNVPNSNDTLKSSANSVEIQNLSDDASLAFSPRMLSTEFGIVNGDFESPGILEDSRIASPVTLQYNEKYIPDGWTLDFGSIKYIRSDFWNPSHGNYCVCLNGNSSGALSQTFVTQWDSRYNLSVDLSVDPDLADGKHQSILVRLTSSTLNVSRAFSLRSNQSSRDSLTWYSVSVPFEARANEEVTLSLVSLSSGDFGVAIDNVRLEREDALLSFTRYPNTAYQFPQGLLKKYGPDMSAPQCASACLALGDFCTGFSVDIFPETGTEQGVGGKGINFCFLYSAMKQPFKLAPYNMDSYLRKDSKCFFSIYGMSANATSPEQPGCPDVLDSTKPPLVCVSYNQTGEIYGDKFIGTCEEYSPSKYCFFIGGYFPVGSVVYDTLHWQQCECVGVEALTKKTNTEGVLNKTKSVELAYLQCSALTATST